MSEPTKPTANERQVGGSHYSQAAKGGKQHWDESWELYREVWFVENIRKYITRYRHKDGIKDLEKAKHYLEKLIELEKAEAEAKAFTHHADQAGNTTSLPKEDWVGPPAVSQSHMWSHREVGQPYCAHCGCNYESRKAYEPCDRSLLLKKKPLDQQPMTDPGSVFNIRSLPLPITASDFMFTGPHVGTYKDGLTPGGYIGVDPTTGKSKTSSVLRLDREPREGRGTYAEVSCLKCQGPVQFGDFNPAEKRVYCHCPVCKQGYWADTRSGLPQTKPYKRGQDQLGHEWVQQGRTDIHRCVDCGCYKGYDLDSRPCTNSLEGNTEPCCECGEDYPAKDLIRGEIYCRDCRDKEAKRKDSNDWGKLLSEARTEKKE